MAKKLAPIHPGEVLLAECSAVFEHVYESYPERNAGVYGAVV